MTDFDKIAYNWRLIQISPFPFKNDIQEDSTKYISIHF